MDEWVRMGRDEWVGRVDRWMSGLGGWIGG